MHEGPVPLWLRYILAVGSGLAVAAAFPPLGWWPLILVAWPMLLVALRGAGLRHGRFLGLTQGLVSSSISLSWMLIIFDWLAPGLWLIIAGFGWLAGALIGWASVRHARWPWLPVFVALVWSALEFVRAELFPLAFPWLTAGLGLGPTWLSPLIGVYGAGFLVLLAAGMLVFGSGVLRVAGIALTVLLAGLGFFRPSPVTPSGPGVPVLAVQNESCDFFGCHALTRTQEFSDGIILWPEYAAPFDLEKDEVLLGKARKLAKDRNATLILGTERSLGIDKHYNEALTLDASGKLGAHDKNHPVPLMNDGLPGQQAVPVNTRFGKIGTPICFDCDFTGVVRQMTAAGAEAFAVPSMDAKAWSAKQHRQHAELFRHRALENGRWIIVSATSGVTQLIDPHGNRRAEIPILQDGVMVATLHLSNELTVFTRVGWLWPWLVLAAALAMTAGLFWRSWRQPQTPATQGPATNNPGPSASGVIPPPVIFLRAGLSWHRRAIKMPAHERQSPLDNLSAGTESVGLHDP